MFTLSAPWLSNTENLAACRTLCELSEESGVGEVVVFEWVQWLLANVRPPDAYVREEARRMAMPKGPQKGTGGAQKAQAKAARAVTTVIHSGPVVQLKTASFQAHAARVRSAKAAAAAYEDVKAMDGRVGRAQHNIMAFRVKTDAGKLVAGHDDDGERDAGKDLAQLLGQRGEESTIVVVSCWLPKSKVANRFRTIVMCASDLLEQQ